LIPKSCKDEDTRGPRVLLLDYWISYVVLAKAAPA